MIDELTIERGGVTVEFDSWGGVYIFHDGDDPVALSPAFMEDVDANRERALNYSGDGE